MSSPPKFRVAIVGAGIGGVLTAVGLSKFKDIAFDIYEARDAFAEVGAGVTIHGRAFKALCLLGMEGELAKIEDTSDILWRYRRSDVADEAKEFSIVVYRTGSGFHRAQFLQKLVSFLPPGHTHFNKQLQTYTQCPTTREITLYFEDGTTATCDVLIGADGIKSPTRGALFAAKAKELKEEKDREALIAHHIPRFTGTVAYRSLISCEKVVEAYGGVHPAMKHHAVYCGKDIMIVVYPITHKNVLNTVWFHTDTNPERQTSWGDSPWVGPADIAALDNLFEGYEKDVRTLIECMESATRWAIHDLDPLPLYVSDRVALIGDAAHATTPYWGAGACGALEDAFFLSHVLGSPATTRRTLPLALKVYEKIRLPRGNLIVTASRSIGDTNQFNSPIGTDLEKIHEELQTVGHQVNEGDAQVDLEAGLKLLHAMIEEDERSRSMLSSLSS